MLTAITAPLVLIVMAALLLDSNSAVSPKPDSSIFWQNRFDEINQRTYPEDGEPHSATGQAVCDEYFSHTKAANIGIDNDRTESLLWRLEYGTLDGISPKLAALLIGTNNRRSNTTKRDRMTHWTTSH